MNIEHPNNINTWTADVYLCIIQAINHATYDMNSKLLVSYSSHDFQPYKYQTSLLFRSPLC